MGASPGLQQQQQSSAGSQNGKDASSTASTLSASQGSEPKPKQQQESAFDAPGFVENVNKYLLGPAPPRAAVVGAKVVRISGSNWQFRQAAPGGDPFGAVPVFGLAPPPPPPPPPQQQQHCTLCEAGCFCFICCKKAARRRVLLVVLGSLQKIYAWVAGDAGHLETVMSTEAAYAYLKGMLGHLQQATDVLHVRG
eukprot:1157582-Pelagomonas_calceolata.AAC.2